MKHRATGTPRGRPSRLPFDFGNQILDALTRRGDPTTGLVNPTFHVRLDGELFSRRNAA